MDTPAEYGPDEGPAQKVSVSMPAGRIAAVKARVGARGFSAYISAAVERQIQRDLLEELLQAKEAEIGPPNQEIQDWAAEIFREAEGLSMQERVESAAEGESGWDVHKAG
ncbi:MULTISPECIES: hypothetical protein [unclassified Streptomyces]|uniref:hypothetical protein n=1 Tax=unclassified Streptomyces TaxID=2593676 RepID=UPI0022599E0A|nr:MULTISPECIES: hypothetical protein [unclassified Streptomyces]WSP57185.1 hypothetical protein OG306_24505 [Streptomyces sp. NBC_01241]WTE35957.1 hypothetical protein OH735_24150 [Streptomyces sp. NBC_01618]MCX4788996.1 hypothetical protein [Streptomyces sp. NBC_01221]MCX4795259.1 hypothetical protein [Streptomyces sp. NBC_01242]WSJ36571.1 hypothetical protein OG772_11345 [Streptomyces sp. NBC_01321]